MNQLQNVKIAVNLTVNNVKYSRQISPNMTLLDFLRDQLDLTGTKKVCDRGECGACTVLINGKRINSCMTLAIMNQNVEITTIEGLAQGDNLHPIQTAFIECDAFQCGYCTPGQIMSAVALLSENPQPSELEIKEGMSGNLCRCGAYSNIVAAIKKVTNLET